MDRYKHDLICPFCGAKVLSEVTERLCYKCGIKMKVVENARTRPGDKN